MLVDFQSSDFENSVHCDVCIIGAGAAGITLAYSMIDSGIQVCLLESGGLEYTEEIQSLYDGENIGIADPNPSGCRLRYFGGTTNHWSGWCAPLQDIDFETRSWIPNSGWPIRREDILPYYRKAEDICQIGPYDPALDSDNGNGFDLPDFSPVKANIRFFRFSPPTRFGPTYRKQLDNAKNIQVVLHANVTRLSTNETATRVRAAHLQTLQGKSGTVRADTFVIACGGMENARLLLLSNEHERHGLGNSSGLVGRYFMQHLELKIGNILVTDQPGIEQLSSTYRRQGTIIRPDISISTQAQEKHGTLNSGFTIDTGVHPGIGYKTLKSTWLDLKTGRWPENFPSKLLTILKDLGSVKDALFDSDTAVTKLIIRSEQLPNRNSQISLSDDLDAFGSPKIRVNWQLTQLDKHSVLEATHRTAEELGRLGLGRIRLADWMLQDNDEWHQHIWGGCHHMGTTRMSGNANDGVVDSNCKVHGIQNLYMAGSSVFPTSGYVPPTFTIVALALRLADHLKERNKNTAIS